MCLLWLVNYGNGTCAGSRVIWKCFERTLLLRRCPRGYACWAKWRQSRGPGMCPLRLIQTWNSCEGSGFTLNTCAQFAFYTMIYARICFTIKIPTDLLRANWCSVYSITSCTPPLRVWLIFLKIFLFCFPLIITLSSGRKEIWRSESRLEKTGEVKITKEKRITVLDTMKMTCYLLLVETWPLVSAVTRSIK